MSDFSGSAGFIEAKNDGSGGDNWNYKTCKAAVKSSPPTNQHPNLYRPGLPVTATNNVKALKGECPHSLYIYIYINTHNY